MVGNPNHAKDGKFSSGHNAGGGDRAVAKHIKDQHKFGISARLNAVHFTRTVNRLAKADAKKNPGRGMYQIKGGKKVFTKPKGR